jgi:hypothetical protein
MDFNLGKTEKVVFVILILLTMGGVALTNISPEDAHFFWLAMNPVFAIGAIMSGWHRANEQNTRKHLLVTQLFHWGSSLVAIVIIYGFLHTGQLQFGSTGLIIVLVLALSAFLDGIHVGWHFSVLGVLLAVIAVTVSYVEQYIWVIAAIASMFIVITFYVDKHKPKTSVSRAVDKLGF